MSRPLKIGVALAVVFGLLWLLQSRVAEQPQSMVEKPVDPDASK